MSDDALALLHDAQSALRDAEQIQSSTRALLEITRQTLRNVARYHARLAPDIMRDMHVTLGDLDLVLDPQPLLALDVPPAEDLWLTDRRRLRYLDDVDLAALAERHNMLDTSRGTIMRTWREDGKNGMIVGCSSDLTRHGKLLHASLSYGGHLPSWRDVREVKARLFGDVDAMLLLPMSEDYVNVHEFCFHVWQCPDRWALQ